MKETIELTNNKASNKKKDKELRSGLMRHAPLAKPCGFIPVASGTKYKLEKRRKEI